MTRAFRYQPAALKRVQWVVALFVLTVGWFGWVRTSTALEVPKLSGRVNDLAGVLDAQAERALDERLAGYEQQSGRQFALLTVKSLEGEALEPFTLRVVESWKLGQKQKDDGLLLFVAVDDRRMRIEVGYGLEGEIPDTLAGRIIRNVMAPEFRRGDYSAGINKAFDALIQAASGQAVNLPQPVSKSKGHSGHGVWPLIGLAVFLIFGLGGRGRRGGLLFLPPFIGGGGYSGRSSGFRGGGFGGGGGGFGGGGASGNW